jgi:hypothetical protein
LERVDALFTCKGKFYRFYGTVAESCHGKIALGEVRLKQNLFAFEAKAVNKKLK